MYETFFGFSRRPFCSAPWPEDYFPSASMEQARRTVQQCMVRGAGWAMVVGAAGLGKTLLCQCLAQDLQNTFQTIFLSGGGINHRRELWQNFLYTLGQPYRGLEESELRLALVEYLVGQQRQKPGFVLLLDEAHLLPGKLLEEIRILGNLPGMSEEWFRVVLVGAPVLEERLSHPRLEALHQRIVVRCYLEPWTRTETQAYIRTQLQKVSSGRTDRELPISPQAAEAVFQATGGIARLVNQLCDHALFMASEQGKPVVDVRAVEEAWAELQQLPPPSAEVTSTGSQDSIIEFRLLEDEDFQTSPGPMSQEQTSQTAFGSPAQIQPPTISPKETSKETGDLDSETLTSQWEESFLVRPSWEPGGESASLESGWENNSSAQSSEAVGPEQELFFDSFQEPASETARSNSSLSESPTEATQRGEASVWQRLEEIEQNLSEIDEPPERIADNSESFAFRKMEATDSEKTDSEHVQQVSGTEASLVFSSELPKPNPVSSAKDAPDELSGKRETPEHPMLPERQSKQEEVLQTTTSFGAGGAASMSKTMGEEGRFFVVGRRSGPLTVSEERPDVSSGLCGRLEVELTFAKADSFMSAEKDLGMENNPFAELFLEEEWIEDPYLSLSMEGQRPWSPTISLLPKPQTHSESPPPSDFSSIVSSQASNVVSSQVSEADGPFSQTKASSPSERGLSDDLLSGRRLPEVESSGRNISVSPSISQTAIRWEDHPKASDPSELPLIVIEDEVEESSPVLKSAAVTVPRHEYRRLFARLRRA